MDSLDDIYALVFGDRPNPMDSRDIKRAKVALAIKTMKQRSK